MKHDMENEMHTYLSRLDLEYFNPILTPHFPSLHIPLSSLSSSAISGNTRLLSLAIDCPASRHLSLRYYAALGLGRPLIYLTSL